MNRQDATTEELLAEYAETGDAALRDTIIERHENLVRSLAQRFARPGVSVDDLVQTGWIALIRALDRFDPAHGTKFSTYAVHCVVGEIKRYFRDRTWSMRVPRRLQEIAAGLHRMQDRLYLQLQREPTLSEMAAAFEVSEDDLLHAMELAHVYQPRSLADRSEMEDGSDSMSVGEKVGDEDTELLDMIEYAPLREAMESLDERKQKILQMRFFEGCSQTEVGEELHVSQMQISRLERKALQELREAMVQ